MCQFGAHQKGHTQNHTHAEDRNFSFGNTRYKTGRCFSREWCPEQKSCPWRWCSPAKYQCLPVCASPWRQPGLFSDDTHAKRKRSKWACEHELHKECGPFCLWVANLAYRLGPNKDVARSERKTSSRVKQTSRLETSLDRQHTS